jgi:hypothetical protein
MQSYAMQFEILPAACTDCSSPRQFAFCVAGPIQKALRLFERASGACINPLKSKALAVGGWRAHETVRGIEYHPSVTILGITFWGSIEQSTRDSWARIKGKVRVQVKKAHDRDPCLAHRIQYVHNYGIQRKFCRSRERSQQLTTAVTCYIRKGADFRVPISTL